MVIEDFPQTLNIRRLQWWEEEADIIMKLWSPQIILRIFFIVFVLQSFLVDFAKGDIKKKLKNFARAGIPVSKNGPIEKCNSLSNQKGVLIKTPNGEKRLIKVKILDITECGLPGGIISEIKNIYEAWSSSGYGCDKKSFLSLLQMEREESPTETITVSGSHIFQKKIMVDLDSGEKLFGSPECIPSCPVKKSRRKKRSAGKVRKKKCIVVHYWPSKHKPNKTKMPICDGGQGNTPNPIDVEPKPPKKNTITVTLEIWEDKDHIFYFNITITHLTVVKAAPKAEEYHEGVSIIIKIYRDDYDDFVFQVDKISPVDEKQREMMKQIEELEKASGGFDNIVTFSWKKNKDNEYCLVDIIMKPLKTLDSLCDNLPEYLDYLKHRVERTKLNQTTALIVQNNGTWYMALFRGCMVFSFALWYDVYDSNMVTNHFGGEKFLITETNEEAGTVWRRIQRISITWDRNDHTKGKVNVTIKYPKACYCDPIVSIKMILGSNKTREKCPVSVRKLEEFGNKAQAEVIVEELKFVPSNLTNPSLASSPSSPPAATKTESGEDVVEYEMSETIASQDSPSKTPAAIASAVVFQIQEVDARFSGRSARRRKQRK